MTGFELHADFDRDGRVTGNSAERAARLSWPGAVIVPLVSDIAAVVEVKCQRTERAMAKWRHDTHAKLTVAYRARLAEYEEKLAALEAQAGIEIEGQSPATNLELMKDELKKACISILPEQHYDLFDAIENGLNGLPQVDLHENEADGPYVRFFEQAFEWEHITWATYPYFWSRKSEWTNRVAFEDADPMFNQFHKAGYCRVNVPVRPTFETAVNVFLSTGQFPWGVEDGSVVSPDEAADDSDDPFPTIADEIKGQQGAVYLKSEGVVFQDSADDDDVITGSSTNFVDDDTNREINILGIEYMIIAVDVDNQKLRLHRNLEQSMQEAVAYAIGPEAVGVPWRVPIPTSLVLLRSANDIVVDGDNPS